MSDSIERYLDGTLSEGEKTELEQRLQSEPELEKELKAALKARAAVVLTAREQRREELRQRYRPEGRRVNMRLWTGMAVAVAAVMLLFFGLKGSFSQPKEHEDLFASYYQTQSLSGLRSIDNEMYATWKEAASLYNEGRYEMAIPLMKALVADTLFEEQAKVRFFLAMSYMEMKQCTKAEEALNQVPEGSAFAAHVQWYKALCKIKTGELESAKAMLEEIASEKVHIHKSEAEQLLEEM